MADQKLKENPYDVEAWNVLIKEYQSKNIDDARQFYEKLVAQFPFTGRYWKIYIEHEMKTKNYDKVEKVHEHVLTVHLIVNTFGFFVLNMYFYFVLQLFQRCLIKVLHIELWRCYLNYVKVNEILLLLKQINFASINLFTCLINRSLFLFFLCPLSHVCSQEAKGGLSSFSEKMAQAYDFALDKIGSDIHSYPIWNDYVMFLKNVDAVGSFAENQKITAVRRCYQRGVVNPMINIENFWKDYISYEQGINQIIAEKMIADRSRDYMNARRVAKEYEAVTKGLNRNAPSLPPSSRPEDLKQVSLWKKYIAWEKSNPLRTEDEAIIVKRVTFGYEQCLLCLGHYPDVWYEFCAYLEENSRLMNEKGDINQCKALQEEVTGVYERATSTLLKHSILIHFAFADFEESRNRKEKVAEIYNKLLDAKDSNIDPTLVYIQYMKFARRSEGIKAARNVFKRAREDPRSGSQIYTCSALMEYNCSKDTNVTCKIFE
ncbi:cleavage stimulation factor subunit 3-like protein, partial [Leptotrombidium deliense]